MSARNIKACGSHVLVDPLPPEQKTTGGILLAPQYEQPSNYGRVLSFGPKVTELQPGDKVVYSWINGREIEHDGKLLRLLDIGNILGVIT